MQAILASGAIGAPRHYEAWFAIPLFMRRDAAGWRVGEPADLDSLFRDEIIVHPAALTPGRRETGASALGPFRGRRPRFFSGRG